MKAPGMATSSDSEISKPRTILVADDEALIRWSLRQKLEDAGFHVMEADTGQSALGLLAHGAICGVLLDLRLPDISGLEVLKQLRKTHPLCCVWIMTAYGTPEAEAEAARLKVDGFLRKPFNMDALLIEMQARIRN